MGTTGYAVFDADSHVNERPVLEQYIELIPGPFRGRATLLPDHRMTLSIDGEAFPPRPIRQKMTSDLKVRDEGLLAEWHEDPARSGMWDPHRRIADMNVEGIDVSVLFPGAIGLGAHGHRESAMATALSQAYNNWLHQFCSVQPDRLKGVAVLPVQNIEESVEELHRGVTELGFVGGTMPNRAALGRGNLDDPAYNPLWEAAQALDVPICIHNNFVHPTVESHRFSSYIEAKPIHDPVENMLAVQALIFGGVFDHFPGLRLGIMEGGVGWIPFWLDRLTEYYEEFLAGALPRGGPIEYLRGGDCFFSFEVDETTVGYVAGVIGTDRLLFASDYFHHDAKYPNSVTNVLNRTDLNDDGKQNVLNTNAAAFYGPRLVT